jgi:hypothetical protein
METPTCPYAPFHACNLTIVGTFFRASIAIKQRSEVTNSFDNDMTMMLAMGRENNKRSLAMAVVCPPWSTAVQKYWSTQQTPFHHLATTLQTSTIESHQSHNDSGHIECQIMPTRCRCKQYFGQYFGHIVRINTFNQSTSESTMNVVPYLYFECWSYPQHVMCVVVDDRIKTPTNESIKRSIIEQQNDKWKGVAMHHLSKVFQTQH